MEKITVQHELLKQEDKVRFRQFTKNGYDHFLIRLSISGSLDDIDYIEYELHPTFKDNIRTANDRDNGFPIEFWTWGEFEIVVMAYFLNGKEKELSYLLEYAKELPKNLTGYINETPTTFEE